MSQFVMAGNGSCKIKKTTLKNKIEKKKAMKDLDWSNLSFGYMPTDYNVRCYYRDGKWGEIEVCSDEYLKLHMAATCLHYG